jgi:lipopolysaccharide transport system permease protein
MSLASSVRRTRLGYLWWVIEPVLEACVFYVVFGIFFGSSVQNFVAYLLVGLVPFTWLSRSISNASSSMLNARWALQNYRLHPVFFPLAEVLQDATKALFSGIILLIFLIFYGIPATTSWFWVPLIVLSQFALVTAVACFVSSVVPLMEDIKNLVPIVLTMTMFASGIFYDPNVLLTDEWRFYYFLNPMASLLNLYRNVLLYDATPSINSLLVVLAWASIFSALAFFLLKKFRNKFSRLIIE